LEGGYNCFLPFSKLMIYQFKWKEIGFIKPFLIYPKKPANSNLVRFVLVVFTAVIFGCQDEGSPGKPNILLIVADDAGYSDFGAYGSEISTPNIDKLAHEGILFTQFHVAPNCGPTRGSLLTGVDYHRAGLGGNPEILAENQKGKPGYEGHLRHDVVTLGELLKEAGTIPT